MHFVLTFAAEHSINSPRRGGDGKLTAKHNYPCRVTELLDVNLLNLSQS